MLSMSWTVFKRLHSNKPLHKESLEVQMMTTINDALEARIQWVRHQLEGDITTDVSSDFQWLLQHLISIQKMEVLS